MNALLPTVRWRRFASSAFAIALALASGAPGWTAETAAPAAPPASTNSPATPAPIVIPQSVFDPKVRRDPFFPESERLNPRPKNIDAATGQPKVTKLKDALEFLKLNGITGSSRRRFVLINGATFGLQEESLIKTAGGDFRVKVVEIRKNSVLVTVDGGTEPKELFLKED